MPTQDDVRQIVLALPETVEDPNRFAFSVLNKGKPRGLVWVWLERVHPKKARIPNPEVVAIRVADLAEKEFLIENQVVKCFTEPHYNGYPAVLVRLAEVTPDDLRALILHAWYCQAPAALVQRHKDEHASRVSVEGDGVRAQGGQ